MKVLTKYIKKPLYCQTETIEIGISENETNYSDSIEIKVITTMKSRIFFTTGYNKQVK